MLVITNGFSPGERDPLFSTPRSPKPVDIKANRIERRQHKCKKHRSENGWFGSGASSFGVGGMIGVMIYVIRNYSTGSENIVGHLPG